MENKHPGSIFDKDWQQSKGSRKRLERISSHFLSEIRPLPNSATGPVFLPIYIETAGHEQVAKQIADAMAAHCDCMLLNVDRRLQRPEDRSATDARNKDFNVPLTRKNDLASAEEMLSRLRNIITEQSYIPEISLVPLSSQHMALIKRLKRIVIPTVTTLDGIRNTYLNIKKFRKNDISEFSIVMLNSDNPIESQIHFEKLATGALRFLNLNLMYDGYIPVEMESISGTNKYSSSSIMTDLTARMRHNHRLSKGDSTSDPSIGHVSLPR